MAVVSLNDVWGRLYDELGPDRFRWSLADLRGAWDAMGRPRASREWLSFVSSSPHISRTPLRAAVLHDLALEWDRLDAELDDPFPADDGPNDDTDNDDYDGEEAADGTTAAFDLSAAYRWLLGLEPNCSDRDVDEAFRRVLKVVHPDRHAGGSESVLREAGRLSRLATEARSTLLQP